MASTDYSGDLNIDEKILARVVDTYRRVRNTLKFLLANVSDFDPAVHTVPADQLLEIDRYALARTAQVKTHLVFEAVAAECGRLRFRPGHGLLLHEGFFNDVAARLVARTFVEGHALQQTHDVGKEGR